jgi:hypothetical protein
VREVFTVVVFMLVFVFLHQMKIVSASYINRYSFGNEVLHQKCKFYLSLLQQIKLDLKPYLEMQCKPRMGLSV